MFSGKRIVIISLLIGFILASIFIPLSLKGFFNYGEKQLQESPNENKNEVVKDKEPILTYTKDRGGNFIASLIFVNNEWTQSNSKGITFTVKNNDGTNFIPSRENLIGNKVRINGIIHDILEVSENPLTITFQKSVISLS